MLGLGTSLFPVGTTPDQRLIGPVTGPIATSNNYCSSFFFLLFRTAYLNIALSTHCDFSAKGLHFSARRSTIPQNLPNFIGSHQAKNKTLQHLPWNWTSFYIIVRMRKRSNHVALPWLPSRLVLRLSSWERG